MFSLQNTHGLLLTGRSRRDPALRLAIKDLLSQRLARDLGGLGVWLVGVRGRELDDHVPQDVVRDAQDALELVERLLPGSERHNIVKAVGAVVDLVRQLAPAPVVHLADLAARALDNGAKTPDGVLDLLLVELGDDYEHDFVSVYCSPPPVCHGFPKADGPGKQGLYLVAPLVYQRQRIVTNSAT